MQHLTFSADFTDLILVQLPVAVTHDECSSPRLNRVKWSHVVRQTNSPEFIAACCIELSQLSVDAWRHQEPRWCHWECVWSEPVRRWLRQPALYVYTVEWHSPDTFLAVSDIQRRGQFTGDDVPRTPQVIQVDVSQLLMCNGVVPPDCWGPATDYVDHVTRLSHTVHELYTTQLAHITDLRCVQRQNSNPFKY